MGNNSSSSDVGGVFGVRGGVMDISEALDSTKFDEDQLNMWYKQFMKVNYLHLFVNKH